MKHDNTNDIYLYWNRIRGRKAAPDRSEIEPTDIRSILKDTFILEVNGPDQFDFRLAGTRICSLFGQELKRQNLLDLFNEEGRDAVNTILFSTTEDTSVNVLGLLGKTEDGRSTALEMILLPLSLRGRTDTRILGTISPLKVPYWLGMQRIQSVELTSFRMIMPHQHRNEIGRMLKSRKEEEEDFTPLTPHFGRNDAMPNGGRKVGHLFVYDGGAS